MYRPLALLIVLLTAVTLVGGCQGYKSGSMRTAGEFTDDVAIQSRVKMALINDDAIKGLRINTEVHRGVVTLQGRVASHELKERALRLATDVKGVQRVEDRLTVVTD